MNPTIKINFASFWKDPIDVTIEHIRAIDQKRITQFCHNVSCFGIY